MAKSLPQGMCNLPIFMTSEERDILGKIAFDKDMSTGALVRSYIRKALESEAPEKAAMIIAARARHLVAGTIPLAVAAGLTMQMFVGGHDIARRAMRNAPARSFARVNGMVRAQRRGLAV